MDTRNMKSFGRKIVSEKYNNRLYYFSSKETKILKMKDCAERKL